MQINVGDIIVIEAHNDHGIIESIRNLYTYIYWNDGVIRSIDNDALKELIFQNRWKHYAI